MAPIRLRSIGVSVYRVATETPVQTSLGVLPGCAAVIVRATADDDCEGWGEVWCNSPTLGAEHRARLLDGTVAPRWLEEPIAADAPLAHWQQLAQRSPIPLATCENLLGHDFARFLDARCLKVLQPDLAKRGGFTGCLPLGGLAAKASAWLCPHWLGGGIGLLATLHLKAAIGGEGFAEVDANPNPLRDLLAGFLPPVRDGAVTLPELAGLGATPDLSLLAPYLTMEHTIDSKPISGGPSK